MSFVMMVMAFAPLVAPLVGGQIFVYVGWRAIFWLMFGFGILVVALVLFRLRETNGAGTAARTSLVAGLRSYLDVLSHTRAWAYLLCGGFAYPALFAYITGAPFVYIKLFGVRPEYFGLLFGVNVVGLLVGNRLNNRYVTRWGYRRLLGIGVTIVVIGALLLLTCAVTGAGGLVALVIALSITVGPVGMVGATTMAGLMQMYRHTSGAASALFGVSQFGFGALAGALVGLLDNGTASAMALSMAMMAVLSALTFAALRFAPAPAMRMRDFE